MASVRNKWNFTVRINNVRRISVPSLQAKFPNVEIFDPAEHIAKLSDPDRIRRFSQQWPNRELIRVIIPISKPFDCGTLITVLQDCGIRTEEVDVILGLLMENDTEFSPIPKSVLNIIRALPCAVIVNCTFMGD